jgi:hypothetical protein
LPSQEEAKQNDATLKRYAIIQPTLWGGLPKFPGDDYRFWEPAVLRPVTSGISSD